jgi:glycosyltransferase involved in cell wall biosynthesis
VIEYQPWVEDVRPLIADSSVFVLPSYREGTPHTVLEAMAMGRPIITTDAPGCRETVRDGENGFLVAVRNVPALVEAMARFVHEPDLVKTMGRRSRLLAEEKFDVADVNRIILRTMGLIRAAPDSVSCG